MKKLIFSSLIAVIALFSATGASAGTVTAKTPSIDLTSNMVISPVGKQLSSQYKKIIYLGVYDVYVDGEYIGTYDVYLEY